MLIIPAIDLRGGHCVRLIQGDYSNQRDYDGDPAELATRFSSQGAGFIHVVDLDGAKSGEPQNWSAIETIVRAAKVPVEVGGGVRSIVTAQRLLDLGVARVIVGSKLVQDEELADNFFSLFGPKVVAGIDARDGLVATDGWTAGSSVTAIQLAQRVSTQGAARIILTDIAQDGMLAGPNLNLLREVQTAVSIPIIHSGGIGSLEDIRAVAECSPEGVIIGRAIYEKRFNVSEAVSAV
jgi:phosphoribosylformimino-5-aminoimidazole carboxamide ribotide isomerase